MIPILLYHQVADVPTAHDPQRLAVAPQQFAEQMSYLYQAGYRCMGLGEAMHHLREGLPLPKNPFVITFDDGYRDLLSTAWPILKRYDFTATVFLVAGRTGRISNWEGQRGPAAAPLLSEAEVRELADEGITFGSHTLTHPRLTTLSDEMAMHEIRQAKCLIEDQLKREIAFFSYPYHDYDKRIQHLVAQAGYEAACGQARGEWGYFNLWRTDCRRSDNHLKFLLKVRGGYHQFSRFREHSGLGRSVVRMVRSLRQLHTRLPSQGAER